MKRQITKSAVSGRFVSPATAEAQPGTTFSQTVVIGTPAASAAMLKAGGKALTKWLDEHDQDEDPTPEEMAGVIWDAMRPLEGK